MQTKPRRLPRQPFAEFSVDQQDAAPGLRPSCQGGGDRFIGQRAAPIEYGHISPADQLAESPSNFLEQIDELQPAMIDRRLLEGLTNGRRDRDRSWQEADRGRPFLP